jgi:hypothetical protein
LLENQQLGGIGRTFRAVALVLHFKVWDVNMPNLVAVLSIVVATILAATTAWRLVCGWLKYGEGW